MECTSFYFYFNTLRLTYNAYVIAKRT